MGDILLFRTEKDGYLDMDSGKRVYEFTPSNISDSIAVISRMYIHIKSAEKRPPVMIAEGTFVKYSYSVTFDPKIPEYTIPIGNDLKYSKGEIDRFSIGVTSNANWYIYKFTINVDYQECCRRQALHDNIGCSFGNVLTSSEGEP